MSLRGMGEQRSDKPLLKGLDYGISLLLIACTLSAIVYVARTVLPETAITTDEHSYQMQAQQFLQGKLKYPYPGDYLRDFVWHRLSMVVCDPEHGWFSRYPPGHALWILPGVAAGAPFVMPVLAALVSLLFLGQTAKRMGIARPLMLYLMAICPFFVFIHGTLLSHTTAFMAACMMLYGYVRWYQSQVVGWAVFSGLAWSGMYLTRPFTAFLIGLFFGLHAVTGLWFARTDKKRWIGVVSFAGAAGVGVVLTCLYNYLMLGDPFMPPYLFYQPMETLGFGPDSMNHTSKNAWFHLLTNVILWDQWQWGIHGTIFFIPFLWYVGWRKAWSGMFLGIFISFWIGYFFFHYPGPHEIGPGYYFETLPFVMLAMAMGFQRILDDGRKRPVRLAVGLLLLLGLPLATVRFYQAQVHALRAEFSERTLLYKLIREAPPNALVIFEHIGVDKEHYDKDSMLMYYPHGLDSNPLMMPNYNDGATALVRLFADRDVYRLYTESIETMRLEPWSPPPFLDVTIPAEKFFVGVGRNVAGESNQVFRVGRPGPNAREGMIAFGKYILIAPGTYEITFDALATDEGELGDVPVATLDITAQHGRIVLWEHDLMPGGDRIVKGTFTISEFTEIEPRVFYHNTGDGVAFAGVRLRERMPESP